MFYVTDISRTQACLSIDVTNKTEPARTRLQKYEK